jgi:hypothetical protein
VEVPPQASAGRRASRTRWNSLRRAVEEGLDLVGFGAADVGEQGERFPPAGEGRVGFPGAAQGVADHEQGAGLAEAVAGLTVEGERLLAAAWVTQSAVADRLGALSADRGAETSRRRCSCPSQSSAAVGPIPTILADFLIHGPARSAAGQILRLRFRMDTACTVM